MPTAKKIPPHLGAWGERGLISFLLPSLQKSFPQRFLVGPGDDAAVMKSPSRAVLSIDGLTDGTHFKWAWGSTLRKKAGFSLGRGLGWKLLGSSLSDLAAMGDVRNRWAMIFVAAPGSLPSDFLREFFKGLNEMSRRYDCAIAGGDTVRSRTLTLVAAVGGTHSGSRCLTRTGARPGDLLCVAGHVGNAAIGLRLLQPRTIKVRPADRIFFIRRFFDHKPLFDEGRILSGTPGVSSLIDLSDSFQESVELLLSSRKLGFELEITNIPVSAQLRRLGGIQPSLLTGGEDYALLFTASPAAVRRLGRKIDFSVVGQVLNKRAGFHLTLKGQKFNPPRYFHHFH